MASLLHNLLVCTISGSIMFGLGSLLNLKFKRSSMSRWYYTIMIMSLLMFVIPLQLVWRIPKLISISIPSETAVINTYGSIASNSMADTAHHISPISVIFGVWLIGALTFGILNIILYIKAAGTIKRISRTCMNPNTVRTCERVKKQLKIHRKVRVAVSDSVSSPLLFGIINPTIIIPDRDFDDDGLKMIFAHELTHLKHFDLNIKLLGIFVSCIHWFNPIVCLLRRTVNTVCEWCCDESVLKRLNLKDNKDYGRLIISVIESGGRGLAAYSTSMASAKSHMKRRLLRIAGFREVTKTLKTVSVLLAAAMSVCSLTAFGFTQAAAVLPDEIAPVFEEPVSVAHVFSASPNSKKSSAPEHTFEPEPDSAAVESSRDTEAENEGYTENMKNTENTENAEAYFVSETEENARDEVFDNTADEKAAEAADEEITDNEEIIETAESEKLIVTDVAYVPNVSSVSYDPIAEPTLEPEYQDEETQVIQIPGKSVYVFDAVYNGFDSVSTPILEVVKSTNLSITAVDSPAAMRIYKCSADGSNAECVYEREKDVLYNSKLPVTAGEYYYITITRVNIDVLRNTLIIQ